MSGRLEKTENEAVWSATHSNEGMVTPTYLLQGQEVGERQRVIRSDQAERNDGRSAFVKAVSLFTAKVYLQAIHHSRRRQRFGKCVPI